MVFKKEGNYFMWRKGVVGNYEERVIKELLVMGIWIKGG